MPLPVKQGVRPLPWAYKKATRSLGKFLKHYSLYDGEGEYISGGFSEDEAKLICAAINA